MPHFSPAVLAVLLLATFIRSAFGFGEALVAVPLLSLFLPPEVAVPVAALASITVAAVVLAQDWREVHFRAAVTLVAFTLLGIPLGLLVLKKVPAPVVKCLLAVVIIAFSTFCLLRPPKTHLTTDRSAPLFGFLAGVLGGAYGFNGPPLAIYGALRRWSPQHFRATLQGYFLPASVAGVVGYASFGLITPAVTRHYLTALPVILVATFIGRLANRRMTGHGFIRYVHGGLILTGLVLLWKTAVA